MRPHSHRFKGGRSHVFCFDVKPLGTWLFSTTVKVIGTVAHQWMDLIINIQRSRTPFVFEICLIPLQSVLNTDTDESWLTFGVRLSNVCFRLPLHTPRSLHSRGQCQNARSLSVNLSPFYPMFFCIFFIGCDPQMYTVGGNLFLIWSPPRLLYHNWLVIRSRTPIRCQE